MTVNINDLKIVGAKLDHLESEVAEVTSVLEKGRIRGHAEVLSLLQEEAMELVRVARNLRALGQEIPGKYKEESAKYLLSLISSLPTRLRGAK